MTLTSLVSIVLFLTSTAFGAVAEKTFTVSPASSKVVWVGKKVTGQHTGNIAIKSGEVTIASGAIKSGRFVIDMASLTDNDLTDATYNKKLTTHLKSDDFFNIEKYPTSEFTITGAEPIAGAKAGANNFTVKGNLRIRDVTQPISFPATITITDKLATAKGTMKIDRTKFGLKYGSGKFFQGLGDHLIYDDFTVDVDLHAE